MQRPVGALSISLRSSVIAAALLLAGALAAAVTVTAQASGTSASDNVRISLGYTCSFPTETQQAPMRMGVTIAATFPSTATAGRRIQPTGVQVTVRLPAAAVAALRTSGATAVSSTAILTVNTSQRTTTTSWQGQAPAAQPLPSTGGLAIVAPGHAAPVTATSRGTVTFTAGNLALALYLDGAASGSPSPASGSPNSGNASPSGVSPSPGNGSPVGSGSPSPSSSGLGVACTPASHRATTIDAIPVASASSKPHRKPPAARQKAKLPKGCAHVKVHGSGVAVCGYITGYSDVTKLYGAALLQPKRPARPALVNIDLGYRHVFKPGRLIEYSTGELYYHGRPELPPVRSTFLAFGFVPVTATLMVTELTPINIRSVSGTTGLPFPLTLRATTRVRIRISDVDVNGVPLAIGPHCRPVTSTPLTLTGRGDNTIPPRGYTLPTGGPLSGRLTIPAFTNCGVTENLDPLLTGSISGPGNFVLMTQGKLCGPAQPQNWTCPPPVPKPIR
jgi:hypothetical protein